MNDDLEARGIVLIVTPTPQKPAVHPDKLADRYDAATVVLESIVSHIRGTARARGHPRFQAIEIAR